MFSTFTIIAVTLIVLIVAIATAARSKKDGFISNFLNKLSVINGFLAAVGIYITYSIFKAQADKMSKEITLGLIDRSWLNINQKIMNAKDTCPTLVNSLYFPWQRDTLGKIQPGKSDSWTDCSYLSITMFQAWEDYLTMAVFDETGDQVWLANFVQWAASPILKKNWEVLKTNFAPLTIDFGDYLFYIMSTNKPTNALEHNLLTKNILKDPSFIEVKRKRGQVSSSAFSII